MITEKEISTLRQEYEDLYENFLGFMLKNNILFNVSKYLFDNFPANLPELIIDNFENFIDNLPEKNETLSKYNQKILNLRKQIIKEVKSNPNIAVEDLEKINQDTFGISSLGTAATIGLVGIILLLALMGLDLTNKNIKAILNEDFKNVIFSRQLIMIIAHLEAFIIESVKIICKIIPQKLLKERTIEYSKILHEDITKQKLIDILADDFVEKLGCNVSFEKSIDVFNKEFKINLSNEKQLKILKNAEQIRHLYVHKGGIIDRKFLDETRKKLVIGERYQLEEIELKEYYTQCILLGTEMFDKIMNMKTNVIV